MNGHQADLETLSDSWKTTPAQIVPTAAWATPRVHVFDEWEGTGEAYDDTQTNDEIHDGDILVVPSEGVVGIMVSAWPTAITTKPGQFHSINEESATLWPDFTEAWKALDNGKYAESFQLALKEAEQRGYTVGSPEPEPELDPFADKYVMRGNPARHSDPEIDRLYAERRMAAGNEDWGKLESIEDKLRDLDPDGDWRYEGNNWDGQGWQVRRSKMAGAWDLGIPIESPVNYQYEPLTEQELAIWRQLDAQTRAWWKRKARDLNQRAVKGTREGRVSPQELAALWGRYQGRCAYDGQEGATTFDHVIPMNAGGTNTIDNLLPVHDKCNRDMKQWDATLGKKDSESFVGTAIGWSSFEPKRGDYNGYTNWDTWNTKLMMDNEEGLYYEARRIVSQSVNYLALEQWAIETIIGPHNSEAIKSAQEWNDIPEDERLDHNFEDLKERNPDAADLVDELGFGADVSDTEPVLIDPNEVDWNEIYASIEEEIAENERYEQEQAAKPKEPLVRSDPKFKEGDRVVMAYPSHDTRGTRSHTEKGTITDVQPMQDYDGWIYGVQGDDGQQYNEYEGSLVALPEETEGFYVGAQVWWRDSPAEIIDGPWPAPKGEDTLWRVAPTQPRPDGVRASNALESELRLMNGPSLPPADTTPSDLIFPSEWTEA